jgi:4-amino-4-deoxy-L-arabinose transferase-like glycosyltransferase
MRAAAASALRRLRGVPVPLRLILAVAALEVVCWVAAAPPWEGPDESAHFAYVQHYAEIGDAPIRNFPKIGAGSESTQQGTAEMWFNLRPTVGQYGSRPFFTPADKSSWNRIEKAFPQANRADGYGPNSQAQNPPAYYIYESAPYKVVGAHHLLTTTFWMRIWSGVLFVLSVLFTWLAAGELFGRRRSLQALAAAAVALLPQLAYMGSIVNADVALTAIWCCFTWLALRLLKRGPSAITIIPVALVVALSIVTHGRGLPLAAPGLLALILTFVRHRRFNPATLIPAAIGIAIVLVALRYAFHVTRASGGSAYGGEARFVAGGFTLKGFLSYVWQFYFPRLPGMAPKIGPAYGFDQVFIFSFFGAFGSLEIGFPSWVYDWLHAAELIGVVALLAALWVKRRAVLANWDVLLVLASMFGALLFVLHFVAYRDMLGQPGDPVLVGRYFLPLVSLWALGIATVASALPRRAAIGFGAVIAAAGVLLQLSGLGLTVTRFYG